MTPPAPSALRWRRATRARRSSSAQAAEAEEQLEVLAGRAEVAHRTLVDGHRRRLADGEATLLRLGGQVPDVQRAWDAPAWSPSARGPAGGVRVDGVRIGRLLEAVTDPSVDLPAMVAWPPGSALVVLGGQAAAALGLLRSLLWRVVVGSDGPTKVTVLDPSGFLPARPGEPWARVGADADPASVITDMAALAAADGCAHLLTVVGHPGSYDRRARQALGAAATSLPSDVRFLIHHQGDDRSEVSLPDGRLADRVIDAVAPVLQIDGGETLAVGLDEAPPEALARLLGARLAARPATDRRLPWAALGHPAPVDWWEGDASEEIRAPVGVRADGRAMEVAFGVGGAERRPCAHGVVVAMTGAGKTGLLHALIASLVVRYGPEDLRLMLVDGKSGVGFAAYRDLPHAEVVVLRARPALARSVLDEARAEMERRHDRFKDAGVEDLAAHRAAGSPGGRLARTLIVVDEFQMLFDGDSEQRGAASLLRLSEQARSAGIHLLLGSQHFAPATMAHRDLIFANLHLRIALQMAPAEAAACRDFGPEGRRLISTVCRGVGRAVINDQAGEDRATASGRVAYLGEDERRELVAQVRSRRPGSVPTVVDGEEQPDLVGDPMLGEPGSGEGPSMAMTFGTLFALRGRAGVALQGRPHDHIGIVADHAGIRSAMVVAALLSVARSDGPRPAVRVVLGDPASAEGRLIVTAAGVVARAGIDIRVAVDAVTAAEVIEGLERRRVAEGGQLLVLVAPDRLDALTLGMGDYGPETPPLGRRLQQVLDGGAQRGIHVLAAFSDVGSVRSIMAERHFQAGFAYRIALQMGEDDSFSVVGSAAASRLQPDGPHPIAGVLLDQRCNRRVLFKPYGPVDPERLDVPLAEDDG